MVAGTEMYINLSRTMDWTDSSLTGRISVGPNTVARLRTSIWKLNNKN